MKNLLEGFKSKFEENSGGRKKSWSNLEDRSIEIILSEEKLKMNGTSETCGALSCILIRNQSEKEKKKKDVKGILEEIMTKTCQIWKNIHTSKKP